jgi:hypothetical protein
MKVICKDNTINNLDKRLLQFAFGQDEDGKVDLTIGNSYEAYGIRKNKYGEFYLVTTDELNRKLPWWMPAGLFEPIIEINPEWVEKKYGFLKAATEIANKYYFGYEEDIEDGTKAGYEAFKMMKSFETNSSSNRG